MWFDLKNWEEAAGPIYMGANSSWEMLWTLIAAALCIVALIVGSRHELDAYKRMKQGKDLDSGPL
ncbi:MAG: hypothetical protein ACWA5A_03540 [Marinibacterium sp.]